MMGLHLERSGFLIAIAVTLMCSAAIVYYVNGRLRSVQTAMNRQSAALAQALACVRAGAGGGPLATDSAIQAAAEYEASGPSHGLIPVSEDEETDDDDSSVSDYESDESEEERSEPPGDARPMIDYAGDTPEKLDSDTVRDITYDSVVPSLDADSEIESVDSSTESSTPGTDGAGSVLGSVVGAVTDVVADGAGDELTVTKMDEAGDPLPPTSSHDIRGMRVQQLRELAINRNGASEEEVKGMKKGELVQLLLDE